MAANPDWLSARWSWSSRSQPRPHFNPILVFRCLQEFGKDWKPGLCHKCGNSNGVGGGKTGREFCGMRKQPPKGGESTFNKRAQRFPSSAPGKKGSMDTPSLIDALDVLNIPKNNRITQILHPGSQCLFQTFLSPFLASRGWEINSFLWNSPSGTTWQHRDHLGSPDPDFRWKLGILFPRALVGREKLLSMGKKV